MTNWRKEMKGNWQIPIINVEDPQPLKMKGSINGQVVLFKIDLRSSHNFITLSTLQAVTMQGHGDEIEGTDERELFAIRFIGQFICDTWYEGTLAS